MRPIGHRGSRRCHRWPRTLHERWQRDGWARGPGGRVPESSRRTCDSGNRTCGSSNIGLLRQWSDNQRHHDPAAACHCDPTNGKSRVDGHVHTSGSSTDSHSAPLGWSASAHANPGNRRIASCFLQRSPASCGDDWKFWSNRSGTCRAARPCAERQVRVSSGCCVRTGSTASFPNEPG